MLTPIHSKKDRLIKATRLFLMLLTDDYKRKHFVYSTNWFPDQKITYCETPKVACSRVKQILYKHLVGEPPKLDTLHHDFTVRYCAPIPKAKIRAFDKLKKLWFYALKANSTEYYKFCLVRNPYDRLVSAYSNKFENKRDAGLRESYTQQVVELYNKANPSSPIDLRPEDMTFAQFVKICAGTPDDLIEGHFKGQWHGTYQDYMSYDAIVRVEDMVEEFPIILEKFGFSKADAKAASAEKANTSERSGDLVAWYGENGTLAEMVYKRYQQDFEQYRYTKESWKA